MTKRGVAKTPTRFEADAETIAPATFPLATDVKATEDCTVDGTKVGMLVAADQEGGEVQQLTGTGFTPMPSGLEQAQDADLRASAQAWGSELKQAGVNVNLAPVADTVSPELGRANAPIGGLSRQYATEPGAVSTPVTAPPAVTRRVAAAPATIVAPRLSGVMPSARWICQSVRALRATTAAPALRSGWRSTHPRR